MFLNVQCDFLGLFYYRVIKLIGPLVWNQLVLPHADEIIKTSSSSDDHTSYFNR